MYFNQITYYMKEYILIHFEIPGIQKKKLIVGGLFLLLAGYVYLYLVLVRIVPVIKIH